MSLVFNGDVLKLSDVLKDGPLDAEDIIPEPRESLYISKEEYDKNK